MGGQKKFRRDRMGMVNILARVLDFYLPPIWEVANLGAQVGKFPLRTYM